MAHFSEMFNENIMKDGGFFENMMAGGMGSRHGYKLMYLRKRANNTPLEHTEPAGEEVTLK